MIKRYLILSALALTCSAMQAERVENYVQDFESQCSVTQTSCSLPGSWGHLADGYKGDKSTYFPTYTYKTTGGVDNSRCIYVDNQTSVGSYNDSWGSSYDLLVTPEVSGEITVAYKKGSSYSDGCLIEFYYLVEEGEGYTRGDMIEVDIPELSNSEYKTISFNLPTPPRRIGIRVSYGYLDHFTAEVAEVEKKRALTVKNVVNNTEGKTNPVCNPENKFTLKAHVTLENTGEADINPGDKDATVSLCWASDYKGTQTEVIKTVPIEEVIPAGGSVGMDVEGEVDCNIYPDRACYGIKENVTGSFDDIAWFNPNLYKPKFILLRSDKSQVSESTVTNGNYTVEYGRISGPVTKVYNIKNDGAGPLVLTSVETPEWVTVTPGNFTVEYGSQQEISIVADAQTYGPLEDFLKFNIEGVDPIEMKVSATVLEPGKYYESFEECTDKKFPADMIVVGPQSSSRWSILYAPVSDKDKPKNDYVAENNSQSSQGDRLITPLLRFDGTEEFSLDVMKFENNNYSKVSIYYSDDRAEWNHVATLEPGDIANPSNNKIVVTPFAVTILEGEHYVAIECNYVDIDDIYGGTLVDVDHDLYLTNGKTPVSGMVNYDYSATLNIRNLMDETSTFTAALVVDGEVEAETEVEVAALTQSQEVSLGFLAYKPLEDAEAYFEVTAGDYKFKSPSWTFSVSDEQLVAESTVMCDNTTTGAGVPFATNWDRTCSEVVYPASVLDLKEGDVLTKLIYNGYSTLTADKTLKINVWIENCEAASPVSSAPTDVATMTLVAKEYPVTLTKKGSSTDIQAIMEIPFTESFTYTGGNIRIVTHVRLDQYCSGMNFLQGNDDILKNNAINVTEDNKSLDDPITKSWNSAKAPVVTFGIAKEPVKISGNVKSVKENSEVVGLAGAIVTLSALAPQKAPGAKPQTVTYTTTTDENGDYTLNVMQPGLKYNLTVQAPAHYDYTHSEVIDPSEGPKSVNVNMTYDVTTGVESIEADSVTRKGTYSMQGVYLGEDDSLLSPGLYIVNGKKTIIR